MAITISDPIVTPAPPGLVVPPPSIVQATRRLIAHEGVVRAAEILELPASTLTRIRGALPIRRGSLLLAREALSALDAAVEP